MTRTKSLFSLLLCLMMLAFAAFGPAETTDGTSVERDVRTEYVAVSPDETMKMVIPLTG